MNCRKIQAKLPAFALGALSEKQARAVAEHCGVCRTCSEELEGQAKLWGALAQLPGPQDAGSSYPAVLARIEAHEQQRCSFFALWRERLAPSFAGTAALVMLLGLISGVLLSSALYPDRSREPSESVYAEIPADGPPESLVDSYLQAEGQNGQENAL